jgi:succinate dehydrogenase / fumarate reductase cytochrome b subunit
MGVLRLYHTTLGKKVVMAVTGLILVLFVIAHMLGNLHAFEGPDELNAYGVFLREVGYPALSNETALWIVRIVLLVAAVLHITSAVQLTQLDLAGRPVGYRSKKTVNASLAARTMRIGGVILAVFIVYHILHMTVGSVHPSFRPGDVYHNVVAGFSVWPVSLFYLVAMLCLGLHLYHGVWSMFQTLGLNNRGRTRFWGGVATVTAVVVALGFSLVPLAVLAGLVR